MKPKRAEISFNIFLNVYGAILFWFIILMMKCIFPEFPISQGIAIGFFIGSILKLLIVRLFR